MTPTPSPNDINRIIDLIQNSGNDQQVTILLLIVLIMVGTVAAGLVLAIRYKPNLSIFKGNSGNNVSAMDKLIEVLGEYNDNFKMMIDEIRAMREQEDKRVEMRKNDLETQNESLRSLHKKLDSLLERNVKESRVR